MTPQERAGMAAAINEAIARGCAGVRDQFARELEAVRRDLETTRQDLGTARQELETARQDLAQTMELAAAPVFRDALIDAAGALRLVQRNGDTLSAPLVDLPAVVKLVVHAAVAEALEGMRGELRSEIARGLQRLGDAPKWTAAAIYGPGAIVSCYVGRTYVLRDGVKASIGQEPGEHSDAWERIGSHGLRLMKAKPAELEAGDVFTDAESRFIHDGQSTTLFVPRALKQSDLERVTKPLQAQTAAALEQASTVRRDLDAARVELRVVARLAPHVEALEQIVREEYG